MKKALILLMALMMLMGSAVSFAETTEDAEAPEKIVYDYDVLTVGTVTPFYGKFFTQMWGNNASDLDVRMLIHGYGTIEWMDESSEFTVDPSVVSGLLVQKNAAGDRTYTLTFYDDLYYSDGTKITAWDYAFCFLLSMAPEISDLGGSPRDLSYLDGYEDYISGRTKYLSGVHVQNDNTLVIRIKGAYLPYFYELTLLDAVPYPISEIAPGCAVRDDGDGVYIANADADTQEKVFTADLLKGTILGEDGFMTSPSVSSGPYKLVSYDGETAEFELNEYYKGNAHGAKPTIPKLIYRIANQETMLDELANGEYGLITRCVSADKVAKGTELLGEKDYLAVSAYPRNGMSYIAFCCEKSPVDSLKIRQAIAMCMDKDGMVADSVGNYGQRVDGYYGIGQWMYRVLSKAQEYPAKVPEKPTAAQQAAYEQELADWETLKLDDIPVYNLDVAAATALLEEEGWTLNREGEAFDPQKDVVRCKKVGDSLAALELKLICPEGSAINAGLDVNFVTHLFEAGIILHVEEMPMPELLKYYYRQEARDCDMIALASNFDVIFEPSGYFKPDENGSAGLNFIGIREPDLYNLLTDMRKTPGDDLLGYCRKWLAFQKKFQEAVPMISLYSNVYFDYYASVLQNYDITANIGWSTAVVSAFLGDAVEEEAGE